MIGRITTGAQNDLEKVTQMAYAQVGCRVFACICSCCIEANMAGICRCTPPCYCYCYLGFPAGGYDTCPLLLQLLLLFPADQLVRHE
jgi:hypothetical protein